MKKSLIFGAALIIVSFIIAANVSAASVSSQSIDVTVGEVDRISTDDENQDVHTPDTGLFGSEASGAFVAATIAVPTVIIFIYMLKRIQHKRK